MSLHLGTTQLAEYRQELLHWLAELECAEQDRRTLFGAYAITRLWSSAVALFALEEVLMLADGDPQLAQCITANALFVQSLVALQITSIGRDLPAETVASLKTWITQHLAESEARFPND
ncbi:MAG TPA: hypothetical protein VI279_03210 [Rhodocyclaceae bacterium]